jgi:hypothetical protein
VTKASAQAGASQAVDPQRLTPAQLVAILAKAGGQRATEALIASHVAAGAPRNADGTIHFVHYAAWLALQVK